MSRSLESLEWNTLYEYLKAGNPYYITKHKEVKDGETVYMFSNKAPIITNNRNDGNPCLWFPYGTQIVPIPEHIAFFLSAGQAVGAKIYSYILIEMQNTGGYVLTWIQDLLEDEYVQVSKEKSTSEKKKSEIHTPLNPDGAVGDEE